VPFFVVLRARDPTQLRFPASAGCVSIPPHGPHGIGAALSPSGDSGKGRKRQRSSSRGVRAGQLGDGSQGQTADKHRHFHRLE
jgi:hypothetical protein